jgi:hypothetical protein
MKTIILSIIAAGAAAVAVVAPELDRQKGKGNSKDKSKESREESSKETRKTTAGTYWSEDTRPCSVPEPDSPIVIIALAGAAVLMRRSV